MIKYAVIVAGGSGVRMGAAEPKQFLLLKDKPVIAHTLQAFAQAFDDVHIVLVLPQQHISKGQDIVDALQLTNQVKVVAGGETRFHSVQNGLAHVQEPSVVFVHDGVRCLVSQKLITRCYQQALAKGSAIPAVTATDSIRVDDGASHYTINRQQVKIIQTPQTFLSSVLLPAFRQAYSDSFTDEATVVEAHGQEVHLIEGEYNNLKITRPLDLHIAEKLIESSTPI